ncbi:MAG: NAD(P)H-dependent oxidoreductase subunit E [Candidatus Gygaella obscura]|nr:NAD(P)H-dependent oxidoreductase subunit E [Candidatus Gygaella obscura]
MVKTCAVEKKIKINGKDIIVCDESRSKLLFVLQEVQDKKGFISDADMQDIADKFAIHPVEVYSVVSFYSFLTNKKKGKYVIRVSTCVSCQMAGSSKIIKELEKLLKIKCGETTKDKKMSLEKTSCIGMCDQAPAIMINEILIGKVTKEKLKKILKELK